MLVDAVVCGEAGDHETGKLLSDAAAGNEACVRKVGKNSELFVLLGKLLLDAVACKNVDGCKAVKLLVGALAVADISEGAAENKA
jgi:hypothetical protein